MGEVYHADDLVLDQAVALKVLPERLLDKPGRTARFLNEAKLARRITHPNVCRVYDIATDPRAEAAGGLHFISMELVDGEDLASRLRREGPPPVEAAADIGCQVCAGLAAAHGEAILHRDLKPANVLIDAVGKVRISDFGIAALAESADSRSGTPAYMAPEQHRGEAATVRTDLYALGLVLYELFTGQRAFKAEHPAELAWRHCSVLPEPPARIVPRIRSTIEDMILCCLEKDPDDRPASARTVAEALNRERQTTGSVLKALVRSADLGDGDGVRQLVEERKGVLIETAGRRTWLFDRPGDAVRFVLACQDALATSPWRIGVHLGEVERADVSETGDPIDLVVSIEESASMVTDGLVDAARPGQVLLTRGAFDLARQSASGGQDDLRWLAHGSYEIEGLPEPLEIFEVGRSGRAPLSPPPDSGRVRRRMAQPTIAGWRPAPGLALAFRPHWRIERKLSEGGFGEVWLAGHTKTGERRVFKFCFDAERLRALQREITIFRLLKEELGHRDDIARIVDWDLERPPYFIESDYTEGGNLVDWAAARGGVAKLPLATRLEIVAQVATALAAAHSVGVLHKDIKPANVLMTESDSGIRAQLTDFGIGQLTDRKRLSRSGITALGFTRTDRQDTADLGTRLYQAPEVLAGKPATLQADIYALGVVLYQLVAGDFAQALAPGWENDVTDELLREDVAAAVDGSPERRLGNALRLAERLRDLERRRQEMENNRQARQEAQRLKASIRQMRRRRRLTAFVMGILIVVSSAFAALAWRIQREAERADRESRAAERATTFLVDLVEDADPFEDGETVRTRGGSITLLEFLDHGARRADELRGEPEIQSRLFHTLAKIYRGLGSYDAAETLFSESLSLRRQLWGEVHPETLETLSDLGELRRLQGRYDEASTLLGQALRQRRDVLGERHLDVAASLSRLATVFEDQGAYARAEAFYREALEIRRERLGQDHALIADSLNNLALFLGSKMDDAVTAEPLFHEALEMFRRELGEEHPDVASTLGNLAMLLDSQGRYAAAAEHHLEALRLIRRVVGDEHPQVATHLNNLAAALEMQGDYAAAEPLYQEALALRRRLLGDDHPLVALTLNNVAYMYVSMDRYETAVPLFREALKLRTAGLGEGHPHTLSGLRNLAWILCLKGDYAEGKERYHEAIVLSRQYLGEEHDSVAKGLDDLGTCLLDKGDLDGAEALMREALAMRRRLLGDRHHRVARSFENLGRLLVARGDYAGAEPVIRESLAIRREVWPADHWRLAFTESLLGSCLAGLGRDHEAEPLLSGGYERIREQMGTGFYFTRQALWYLDRFRSRRSRRGIPPEAGASAPRGSGPGRPGAAGRTRSRPAPS